MIFFEVVAGEPFPTLMVSVCSPFLPFCFQIFPAISRDFKTVPEVFGLSSQSYFIVTFPLPVTSSLVPSLENFASTPGDDDIILSSAFSSNPLEASSSNLIFLRLSLTFKPKDLAFAYT